jgi:lambda family phage portal protein
MLDSLRSRLARLIAPGTARRSYAGARGARLAGFRPSQGSLDSELHLALGPLRANSRELVRNASYAKRARTIVVNNVIGSGVGLQAQVTPLGRTRMDARVNAAIEEAWTAWCAAGQCHTGGRLHFHDLERLLLAEVFEAGEVFVRLHLRPFGDSRVPLALEVIEAERMADDNALPPGVPADRYRLGIELDGYGRPVAYYIRAGHPNELRGPVRSDQFERVPADQILHLAVLDRWPQTRGVPWLHSAIRRLADMDGYTEAEIVAARASASYMGFIERPEDTMPDLESGSSREIAMEPGTIETLLPGEKVTFHDPSRPNAALDPFMRYMLREVAAGVGVSYESLSRDYSQSNYSSSRLALLDDRDTWRTLQQWYLRAFRQPLHALWLRQAVLARAIGAISLEEFVVRPEKFAAVKFKPRGWQWVDPTKEVQAYKEAIKAGLTTLTDVIAATAGGDDIEDVLATRRRELDLAAELDLQFDTDPAAAVLAPAPAPAPSQASDPEPEPEPEDDAEEPAATPARLVAMPAR